MFIPHHMYVYMYVNILTDTRIHCRAGPAVLYFAALASMTAKRLTGLTAAIRIHYRARPASHCCTGSAAVGRGHCRAVAAVEVRSIGRLSFQLRIFAAFAVPVQRLYFWLRFTANPALVQPRQFAVNHALTASQSSRINASTGPASVVRSHPATVQRLMITAIIAFTVAAAVVNSIPFTGAPLKFVVIVATVQLRQFASIAALTCLEAVVRSHRHTGPAQAVWTCLVLFVAFMSIMLLIPVFKISIIIIVFAVRVAFSNEPLCLFILFYFLLEL